MMQPLELCRINKVAASPKAWFLAGNSVEQWIDELARIGLADSGTKLYVVPRSVRDSTAAGLLAVPERLDAVTRTEAGMPCQLVAGFLFMPVEAALHPPVTEKELRALCPWPVAFFHPALGFSAFEEKDALRVWDLLAAPTERARDWNAARAGTPPLPELSGIIFSQPPSIEDLFGGAEEEIGSDPILELPPSPDEPKNSALEKSGRNLRRALAAGLAGTLRQLPHTGQRRTWVNDLEDWANRQLQGVSQQLERIRHKELHRLLRMLENDPEAGLRHAIPMNSFAHRGVAPPGGLLTGQTPNFDLSRLGGRATDFWNVPPDLQEILRQQYRALADRETRLGRHRRAAYIYAELLGDLPSAAKVLKEGRHFREAALLFDEHLKNPLEAARCLAEGGLIDEALERFVTMGLWLEVADLHGRMGNHAAAEAAVRRVVAERIQQGDVLGAAKLLEERLQADQEALELLQGAWPESPQAAACASVALRLLAKLGSHEAAMQLVNRMGVGAARRVILPLLNVLFEAARDYPHEPVRRVAADYSRRLIGQELSRGAPSSADAKSLVDALARLAPHDRLLARDGNRFLSGMRAVEVKKLRSAPPPISQKSNIAVVRRIELPRQIEWLALRQDGNCFFAAGITQNRLTVIRGLWEGEFQSLSWACAGEMAKRNLVMEPVGFGDRGLAVAILGGERLEEKRFPGADAFLGLDCMAGSPAWMTPQEGAFAFGGDSIWTAHAAGFQAIVSCHDQWRKLRRTVDVTTELMEGSERSESARPCLACVRGGAAIALGNRLVVTSAEAAPKRVELPGQALRLIPSPPHARAGVAVMMDRGAALHWVGLADTIELDAETEMPMGAFVPGGPFALVSANEIKFLHLDARGVSRIDRWELSNQRPIAVAATSNHGQFATLNVVGEMVIYQAPF